MRTIYRKQSIYANNTEKRCDMFYDIFVTHSPADSSLEGAQNLLIAIETVGVLSIPHFVFIPFNNSILQKSDNYLSLREVRLVQIF